MRDGGEVSDGGKGVDIVEWWCPQSARPACMPIVDVDVVETRSSHSVSSSSQNHMKWT